MRVRIIAILAACALLPLAACGGDDGTPTSAPRAGTASTATSSASPGGTTAPSDTATGEPSETATAAETGTPPPEETVTPEETATAPVDTSKGSCQTKISGDETIEFTGSGGVSAVGTDYWYTEDEMREILRQIASFGEGKTDEQIEQEVEDGMQLDPRFILLLLNCVDPSGSPSISLSPSSGSKYADVPYEARTYVIKAGEGLFGGSETPGEFGVLMTVGETSYRVSVDGEINITKFDGSGIAGTFSFGAEDIFPAEGQTAKVITVEGSFDFACNGQSVCD